MKLFYRLLCCVGIHIGAKDVAPLEKRCPHCRARFLADETGFWMRVTEAEFWSMPK